MNLIKSPNGYSCSVCSFAMAIGITLDEILATLGHNGDAIVFPELPEPLCRQGFHFQEMIRLCLLRGLAVTEIQLSPQSTTDGKNRLAINFPPSNPENLILFMTVPGVIYGVTGRGAGHAVAWDGSQVYDPRGYVYNPVDKGNFVDFSLISFFRLDKIA